MRFEVLTKGNQILPVLNQILENRGIEDVYHYTHLTKEDVCDYKSLGGNNLYNAATALQKAVSANEDNVIIVDSDADGFTSAALLYNYFYRIYPEWTINHLSWRMHEGKQHGLNDHLDKLLEEKNSIVWCPDGASNDYEAHSKLKENGSKVVVLDHHLADKISEDAIIINNQLSDYPNKEACGACIVWQFCRYLDNFLGVNFANSFLDLVALGLTADMMSLHSYETRYLVWKGFQKENISNPFISYMLDKNAFPLSKSDYISYSNQQACTGMGAAFFIIPFINAVTRTGSSSEKELIFKSMLNPFAFEKIPEIKRNKATGKEEYLVLQAVRVIGNIKNRQTKKETAGLEALEKKIQEKNMIAKHKALAFCLDSEELDAGVRGLVANKLMSKYQRPCIIMSECEDVWAGSMRGYTKNGVESFKEILEKCRGVLYVVGHHNAAGCAVTKKDFDIFLEDLDRELSKYPSNPLYRVDYFYNNAEQINPNQILAIAAMNDFWGQDVDRAYVGGKIRVRPNMVTIMKGNTLKISLPNGVSFIKFSLNDEEVETFTKNGWVDIEYYCKCNCNSWNGTDYPQLILESYELICSSKYDF